MRVTTEKRQGHNMFGPAEYEEAVQFDIVNCTPHEITLILAEGGDKIILPPSGIVPRVKIERQPGEDIPTERGTIHVTRTRAWQCEGLPDRKVGVVFIVSRQVAEACGRSDLYIVDETVRDEAGRIIGARGLAQIEFSPE